MPLYRIEPDQRVKQLKPSPFRKERNLQKLFEANLDKLFGVRYMASEFTTGDREHDHLRLPWVFDQAEHSEGNRQPNGLKYR